jgi:hypothetical protein
MLCIADVDEYYQCGCGLTKIREATGYVERPDFIEIYAAPESEPWTPRGLLSTEMLQLGQSYGDKQAGTLVLKI